MVDSTAIPAVGLDPTQVDHFRTFGFIHLPGLFIDEIDEISAGFDEVFAESETMVLDPRNAVHIVRDPGYRQRPREMIFSFIDRSDKLAWLRHDRRVIGIVEALLGTRWEYAESDGNLFNCDVSYHADVFGTTMERQNLKFYFYLDPLTRSTGALRVIPGTNHHAETYARLLQGNVREPQRIVDAYGVTPEELPCVAVETRPGDLVVGDFRTLHGSFGGAPGRRLFTINFTKIETDG